MIWTVVGGDWPTCAFAAPDRMMAEAALENDNGLRDDLMIYEDDQGHPLWDGIQGTASVIDGDTIEVHGQRVRLFGIDAPESAQLCLAESEEWRCGSGRRWRSTARSPVGPWRVRRRLATAMAASSPYVASAGRP